MASSASSGTIIDLRRVSRCYGQGESEVVALADASLAIDQGEFVAVVGPSGSGKSTLLSLISGIDRPTSGEVWVTGRRIDALTENQLARWRRRAVGIVFQFFQLLPTLTALENVLLPMEISGFEAGPARERARTLLAQVGLAGRARHLPSELAGGEQQRVAIARALANDPPLILADEPTGNLDEATGSEIFELLAMMPARGKTVVLVTHDQALAARAGRIVPMHNGRIAPAGGWQPDRSSLRPSLNDLSTW
ncbi:MAG TPA: ABC transporter ATP-binding protein [Chloroflexi bacterium]|nr:ABC transporter ATP-binding protein [Chloroflexota bacterium]